MAKESTVNGRKYPKEIIDRNWDGTEKIKNNYVNCGPDEKSKLKAEPDSVALIESLRRNGQISNETMEYVAVKVYPGGMPKKEKEIKDRDWWKVILK